MHTRYYSRLATILALAATIGIASASPAAFPALNDPSSKETHPGKFVWAELFTSDAAAATKFYAGVFSWTVTTLDVRDVPYTVFSNAGRPVAGLRQRARPGTAHAARWVSYIAVANVDATLALVTKAGGQQRAPARAFPNLGTLAVATDIDGSPFGLLQSSSGDSTDDEPAPGDWNWFHLFVKNPAASAEFYRQAFAYDVAPDSRPGKGAEMILYIGSINRAGISVLPARNDAKPGWLGVIRVANLDDTLAKVPALGGEVMVEPHDAAFGSRFAVIADPTGGTVGLVEYVNNANPATRP